MDTSQQMFAHLNQSFDEMMREESESRRPGITMLCQKIRGAHPDWSGLQVATEAKTSYDAKRRQFDARGKDQYGFSRDAVPFDLADRKGKA